MAKIIALDELIPENLEINFEGQVYVISGDISVPDVLKLFSATQVILGDLENGENVSDAEAGKKLALVEKEVLRIINIARPEDDKLTKCPFGSRSLGIVLVEILKHLLPDMFSGDGEDGPPPSPTPAAVPARPSGSRKRSSRSSKPTPARKR